jgi:hypothetical protein
MQAKVVLLGVAMMQFNLSAQSSQGLPPLAKPAIAVELQAPVVVSEKCVSPQKGDLISKKDQRAVTIKDVVAPEVGEYILGRIRDGYIIRLNLEPDGRIWVEETCPKALREPQALR